MLVIRDEQMAALAEEGRRSFPAHLVAHGLKHFPAQFEGLPMPAMLALAQRIVERAERYQLCTERDVGKYFNLACVFGQAFDADPALPWAAAILGDARLGPTLKINRLYLAAADHEGEGRGLHAGIEEARHD